MLNLSYVKSSYDGQRGFITQEEIIVGSLYSSSDSDYLEVCRYNLKSGEQIWRWTSAVGNGYNNPKTEYSIQQKSETTWEFKCDITLYDGTKHTKTVQLNVEKGEQVSYTES